MILEGRVLNVTGSIGYTISTPDATGAEMLQQAHFAMHHAKKAGRDRAQEFEMEMVRLPQFRLGLETDLRQALAEDQISVMYQPIFAVESGALEGFEALARWTHPERGSVSPADFIPVAEDTEADPRVGRTDTAQGLRPVQGVEPDVRNCVHDERERVPHTSLRVHTF